MLIHKKSRIITILLISLAFSACKNDNSSKELNPYDIAELVWQSQCVGLTRGPVSSIHLFSDALQKGWVDFTQPKPRLNKQKLDEIPEYLREKVLGAQKTFDDTTQYKNILLGDSTLQITAAQAHISGLDFYNTQKTQFLGITGNKICDMILMLRLVHTKNPEAIVVSTLGGNDYLEKNSPENVVGLAKMLFSDLRDFRYSAATKIVFVGVHPNKDPYATAAKAISNPAIAEFLSQQPNTCFVDPKDVLGVAEGELGKSEHLLDDGIHYTLPVGMRIKAEISAKCHVNF